MRRRDFILTASAAVMTTSGAATLAAPQRLQKRDMYGLIVKMTAAPGQRDALIAILLEGVANMPGCLSYVVATEVADVNTIWITEVWDSEASHSASLSLPSVRNAMSKGRPLIAGFGDSVVTTPVGGHGLIPTAVH